MTQQFAQFTELVARGLRDRDDIKAERLKSSLEHLEHFRVRILEKTKDIVAWESVPFSFIIARALNEGLVRSSPTVLHPTELRASTDSDLGLLVAQLREARGSPILQELMPEGVRTPALFASHTDLASGKRLPAESDIKGLEPGSDPLGQVIHYLKHIERFRVEISDRVAPANKSDTKAARARRAFLRMFFAVAYGPANLPNPALSLEDIWPQSRRANGISEHNIDLKSACTFCVEVLFEMPKGTRKDRGAEWLQEFREQVEQHFPPKASEKP